VSVLISVSRVMVRAVGGVGLIDNWGSEMKL
jgi:hypothetical protein